MTDLDAQLTVALSNLRLLVEVRQDVYGEYHPAGQDYEPRRRMQGPPNEGPLPVRLTPEGHPTGRALDTSWRQAMGLLASAFADVSEAECVQRMLFAGEGDNVAQASVRPDVGDEGHNLARLRLAWLVTHRIVDAHAREGLSEEDARIAEGWCVDLDEVVGCLPVYLRRKETNACQGRAKYDKARELLVEVGCPRNDRVTGRGSCDACRKGTQRARDEYDRRTA